MKWSDAMLKYKNYVGDNVEYDAEGKIFTGEVFGLRTVLTFQGRTPDEIEESFKETIELYLGMCKEDGVPPERPYSGKFNVRIPSELHREIALHATSERISINEWVIKAFKKSVH
ncbi:MAG: type II toxin-antitoxin system HicB family antitoxin [Chloroflexi bacterium]|nr:type II toxin-antitoxin system HicB family antitoxin [Chloroflexota bacterium]